MLINWRHEMTLVPLTPLRTGPDRQASLARYRSMAAGYDASCSRILAIRAAAVSAVGPRVAGPTFIAK